MKLSLLLALVWLGTVTRVLGAEPRVVDRNPRRIMLVIGVGSHTDKRWPPLNFADKDAQEFHEKLAAQGYSGPILTPKSTDLTAVTTASMRAALKRLEQQNLNEDDTIVIYYSGHGTLALAADAKSQSFGLRKYFVTADTKLDQIASTGLSQDEILETFHRLKSRRKALIVDACHSGGGKAFLTPNVIELLSMQKGSLPRDVTDQAFEGSGIFTASAWGEEALENSQLGNGVYTHFLLEGMGHDMDGDGAVRMSEAHSYASHKVLEFTQSRQHPTATMEFVGKDPIVLFGEPVREGGPVLYAWQWALRKYDVFVDGKKRGSLGKGGLGVPDGRRRLTLVDPASGIPALDRMVQFDSGQDYSVADYFVPRMPHTFQMSAIQLRWLNTKSLPRDAIYGLGLAYQKRDFIGTAALQLRYVHSARQATRSSVELELNGNRWESKEPMFVTLDRFDLGLGYSRLLRVLSSKDLG
ncbi:MAG: caspase family protein, partial [Pseudobdellovibrionaceae bacterium]|nr:caspase family protein [Pseudobdellovibrionaceae bacterium]